MTSGGARATSGPPAREGSGRSEARGFKLNAISASGYKGRVPRFPLPERKLTQRGADGGTRPDQDGTTEFREREAALWKWVWRTPQALVWSRPEAAWMQQLVARWVRQAVLCEDSRSSASDHAQLHRYAEQVGLTPAGLTRLGWKIVPDAPVRSVPNDAGGTVVSMPARRLRGTS